MKYVWLDFIRDSRYHRQCFKLDSIHLDLAVYEADFVLFMVRDTPRTNSHVDLTPPFEPLPEVPDVLQEGGAL